MSKRNRREAIAWAKGQSRRPMKNWTGMCLQFVRMCYNVPPKNYDASSAWDDVPERNKHRFKGTYNDIPAGVPFFWKGGSRGHGHIVITAGNGLCYSTDAKRRGHVDLVSLRSITNNWHQRPMGWTEGLNGNRIMRKKKKA